MQWNNSDINQYKNKSKLSLLVIKKTNSNKTQRVTSPSATSDNDQEWNIVDLKVHTEINDSPPPPQISYRPISLLPTLSKMFEKILLKRLVPLAINANIIPDTQF